MKKICLIELYSWHSECLYSQILFLNKSGYNTCLVCDVRLKPIADDFRPLVADVIYFDFKKLGSLFKLWYFLIKNHIRKVIFNTAQGSIILKFMLLPFPKKMQFWGIIHSVNKLGKSTGQKIISRKVKRYYLLAEYLENHFPQISKLQKQSFSTAFSMPFEHQTYHEKGNNIWLCIPGNVEYKRRDYDFLLSAVRRADFPQNIKFILLGNSRKEDGQAIRQKIKSDGLSDFFIWFDKYIPDNIFHSYVQASDFVLPLIHGNLTEIYAKYQISGTFVLSDVHGKTMLCDSVFQQVNGFQYNAFYYGNEDDFVRLLNEKPQALPARKVDFEKNRLKYVNFLER